MPSRISRRWAYGLAAIAAVGVAVATAVELSNDHRHDLDRIRQQTGGDPDRGKQVIARSGCGSCHEISGVPGARGLVGPPLKGISARVYVAGRLVNTPDNLAQWIEDPKSVDPLTAMPTLGLSEREARDVVAYLYAKN